MSENDAIAGLLSELVRSQSAAADASRAAELAARDAEAASLKQAASEERTRQEIERDRISRDRRNRNLEEIIQRYVQLAELVIGLTDDIRKQNTAQLPDQIAAVLREWFDEVSDQIEQILDPDRPRLQHFRLNNLVDGPKIDTATTKSLQRRLRQLRKNLNHLLEKKSAYGLEVPVSTLTQIEDIETEIIQISRAIAGEE